MSARPLVNPQTLGPPPLGREGFRAWLDRSAPYQNALWTDYAPILAAHVADLAAQSTVYAEITISPLMFPRDEGGFLRELTAFRRFADELEAQGPRLAFLLIAPRRLPDAALAREAEFAALAGRAGLVAGVSIAGLEDVDLGRFAGFCQTAAAAGLGVSVHAGEFAGPHEVIAAVQECGATRIAHGVSAFHDAALLRRLKDAGVHFEFCLTSNRMTGAVPDVKRHPIIAARDLQLSFSVNTDDPGAFDCTLSSEWALASELCGFAAEDYAALLDDTLAARFDRRPL
jgi:adenosine deaminase